MALFNDTYRLSSPMEVRVSWLPTSQAGRGQHRRGSDPQDNLGCDQRQRPTDHGNVYPRAYEWTIGYQPQKPCLNCCWTDSALNNMGGIKCLQRQKDTDYGTSNNLMNLSNSTFAVLLTMFTVKRSTFSWQLALFRIGHRPTSKHAIIKKNVLKFLRK